MNLGPARGNICYVLDGGERVMSAAKEPTTERRPITPAARKQYPGATLRHLGSVRDVTMAKTKAVGDGFGTKHM